MEKQLNFMFIANQKLSYIFFIVGVSLFILNFRQMLLSNMMNFLWNIIRMNARYIIDFLWSLKSMSNPSLSSGLNNVHVEDTCEYYFCMEINSVIHMKEDDKGDHKEVCLLHSYVLWN